MIYIHPTKPRSFLMRYAMAPLVSLQVLWLHPKNGLGYAVQWAWQSTTVPNNLPSTDYATPR
jgi:hypothetical protein